MRPWRESSSVASTVVSKSSRSLALGLGYAPLRFLLGFAFVRRLRDIAEMVSCACSSNFASAWSVRRSSSLSLADSRFSHSRADLFLALFELRQFLAQFCFERLRLFDAAMQFAQEARDVALAVAHRPARAQHDVFRHPEARGDFEARRLAGQSELQMVRRLERLSSKPMEPLTTPSVDAP